LANIKHEKSIIVNRATGFNNTLSFRLDWRRLASGSMRRGREIMASTTVAGDPDRHSVGRAWYVVAFLAVFYIFSLVDRTIFALLAAPISKDVGLTDAQMGVILGMGFAVVYAVAGLPFAHWLDTRPRKMVVAAGVLLWSAMTIAAAFATNFWSLLVFRSGLAFGEAVLTPAAVSMIGDLFGRERRALPMSVYASVGAIFSVGAFTLGAVALSLATPVAHWAGLEPWRITLIMLGFLTMLLSVLFMMSVSEPARIRSVSAEALVGFGAFFRYLRSNSSFYVPLYIGVGLSSCFSLGFYAWAPTIFQREYGLAPATSGFVFGIVGVMGGVVGSLIVPQITAGIERRWPMRGIPAVILAIAVIQVPASIVPATSSVTMLYFCCAMVALCATSLNVLGSLSFQYYADGQMRARLMALWLLAISLIGLSTGPLLVVFFAAIWPQHDRPLAHGVAILGLCTTPVAGLCFAMAYRGARRLNISAD
jgi:MFS family permease